MGRYIRTLNQLLHGNKDREWFKRSPDTTETLKWIDGDLQWISSGIFSQDTIRCRSVWIGKQFTAEIRWDTRSFQWKYLSSWLVKKDISCRSSAHNEVYVLFKCHSRYCVLVRGQWRFIGLGSNQKVVLDQWRQSTRRMQPYGGEDDVRIGGKRLSNFPCYKSIVSEVDSKAKVMENCRYTMQPIWKRLRLLFRKIVSANQLSLYGAVAEMCEEYETLRDISGQPVVKGE